MWCYYGGGWLLPVAAGLATIIRQPCSQPATGAATIGGRRCSGGRLVLLRWAFGVAPIAYRRCYYGRRVLLLLYMEAGLLQWHDHVAAGGRHFCYQRDSELLQILHRRWPPPTTGPPLLQRPVTDELAGSRLCHAHGGDGAAANGVLLGVSSL